MLYLLILVATLVVATLGWTWWRDRGGRDPVSSIASFHRALDAMQPGSQSSVEEAEGEEHARA